MIFGMPTLIELDGLEETMQLCQELGLDFVELNMNLPQYQVGELEKVSYLKELAERHGLFYTIHLDENTNVCDFNEAVAAAYRDTVRRAIRVAKQLRIPVLNMHMHHGVHFKLPDQRVDLFEQYKERYLHSMQEFGELCQAAIGDAAIKLCIENTDGFRGFERDAIELLCKYGVFALTWDIGHSHACGNVDEEFLLGHEADLYHFHIHDGAGERVHLPLGTGEIDLLGRLAIAEKHGCRCVAETKSVSGLRASVAWLSEQGLL